ncbi:MAG: hypothetical protein V3U90_05970 [Dehalococcoidia bacterium]
MTWIKTVDESKATGFLQDIYRQQKEEWGVVDNFTKGLSLSPPILKGLWELYSTIEKEIGGRRHELIATVVSDINRCTY